LIKPGIIMNDSTNDRSVELLHSCADPREALLQVASAKCRRDELQARYLHDMGLNLALRQFDDDSQLARLSENPEAVLAEARQNLRTAMNVLDTFFKEATTQARAEFYAAFSSANRTAN
jgi:hypothetical protein